MRRRFLWRMTAADLTALVIATSVASVATFGTPLPWKGGPSEGALLPVLSFLLAGAVGGRLATSRLWAGSVPRPSYARTIVVVASGIVATMAAIVIGRP